jgi:DNA repair protein RecN (Recombination protein N)
MLAFLQIRDFAIIESLDLEFRSGFTCITGETGAGKSILVDALGLLVGNRADTGAIRQGCDKAELSAEFELKEGSAALQWLQGEDLDDGHGCLLRRMISSSGRSRAWVNGSAVTLQQLAELGDLLVEIHGQNEHMLIRRRREQLRLLDSLKTCHGALQAVESRFRAWQDLEARRQRLLEQKPLDAGELELLRYQITELEAAALSQEAFEEVEAEHRLLARGSDVLAALQDAQREMDAEDAGINPAISRAARRLQPYLDLDPDIAGAAALLDEAAINCQEAQNTLQAALSRLDLRPERLAELDRQIGVQHDLARKHRAEPARLQEVLDDLRHRVDRAGSLEQDLEDLEQELSSALSDYRAAAETLHRRRGRRADELSRGVSELMQELGMKGGTFEFLLHHDAEGPPSLRGSDTPELRVSANAGVAPGPLARVASGGELSRISLALKVASRADSTAATQVFDEVDAGIGGETANAVGALLKSLAAGDQALCVTHLAQVAAFADQQMQVRKALEHEETHVTTSLLAEQERIDEIARMLGGRLSSQSRAHAAELLAASARQH